MESVVMSMPTTKDEDRQKPSLIHRVFAHYISNVSLIIGGLAVMSMWILIASISVYQGFQYLFVGLEMQSSLLFLAGLMTFMQGNSTHPIFINWWLVTNSHDVLARHTKRWMDIKLAQTIIFLRLSICFVTMILFAGQTISVFFYGNDLPSISPDRMNNFQMTGKCGIIIHLIYSLHMMSTFSPVDIPPQKWYKRLTRKISFAIHYCAIYFFPTAAVFLQLSCICFLEITDQSKVFADLMLTFLVVTIIFGITLKSMIVYRSIALVQTTIDKLIVKYHEKIQLDKNNLGKQVRFQIRSTWLNMHEHEMIPIWNICIHGMDLIVSGAKTLYHGPESGH